MVPESIQYLPLGKIQAGENIRKAFSENELRGLANSLKQVGQLQPVRVRPCENGFVLTDGERRFRAAQLAGWDKLAAIVESGDVTEVGAKQRALVSNCQRADLSPLEIATAIRDLMQATGWNASQVAGQLGFSDAKVSRSLALLDLPAAIQDKIHRGEIPASSAAALARAHNPEEQAALSDKLASGELTRDAVVAAVPRGKARQGSRKSGALPRIVATLGTGRTVTFTGPGLESLDTLIGWLEELLGKARRLRPKNLQLSTFVSLLADEAQAT